MLYLDHHQKRKQGCFDKDMSINPKALENNLKLSDREIKIVMIKYIIHGIAPFYDAPLETRIKLLKVTATQYGFKYDDQEFQELGRACLEIQQKINQNAIEFLNNNEDLYKTTMNSLRNGNDKIITVVDKILDGGLKKLLLKIKS